MRYRDADVKRATGTVTAAATTEIVAAVTGKRIRVIAMVVSSSGANGVADWKSASTVIFSSHHSAGDALKAQYNGYGWFQTVAGEALNMTATTANMLYNISYVEAGG